MVRPVLSVTDTSSGSLLTQRMVTPSGRLVTGAPLASVTDAVSRAVSPTFRLTVEGVRLT